MFIFWVWLDQLFNLFNVIITYKPEQSQLHAGHCSKHFPYLFVYLIIVTALWVWHCDCSHFTNKQTEWWIRSHSRTPFFCWQNAVRSSIFLHVWVVLEVCAKVLDNYEASNKWHQVVTIIYYYGGDNYSLPYLWCFIQFLDIVVTRKYLSHEYLYCFRFNLLKIWTEG